ncbi:hypothetical protein NL676_018928 [Syzygium grande]|nr:hypothetical protein NL676_018928 [Syzygium grande]
MKGRGAGAGARSPDPSPKPWAGSCLPDPVGFGRLTAVVRHRGAPRLGRRGVGYPACGQVATGVLVSKIGRGRRSPGRAAAVKSGCEPGRALRESVGQR